MKGGLTMSKITEVQQAMICAMKAKDAPRKDALSMLLSALKAKEKDKRAELTEDEENAIVLKEIKQTNETLESAPADRTDIIEQCKFRINVMKEFAPERMSEDEIKAVVASVISELGLENPTVKEKGLIMKNLMPKVSGKADGALVNKVVSGFLG
jgi:uncharacterized protein YqeY